MSDGKMEIRLGQLVLVGVAGAGNITITGCRATGKLAELAAALLGINTIDDDSDDRSTDVVKARVDDMQLLQGAPAGAPDLGVVNHLGVVNTLVDMVPPGMIAIQPLVHSTGEVQLALPLEVAAPPVVVEQTMVLAPNVVIPTPIMARTETSTAVATTLAAPLIINGIPSPVPQVATGTNAVSPIVNPAATASFIPPSPVDTHTAPTVKSAEASLTDLQPDQLEVVKRFAVTPSASVEVSLNADVRFDISALDADVQQKIQKAFEKVGQFDEAMLQKSVCLASGYPLESIRGYTRAQLENLVWNILVKEKIK